MTLRTQPTGTKDSLGRQIKISGNTQHARSDAPPPNNPNDATTETIICNDARPDYLLAAIGGCNCHGTRHHHTMSDVNEAIDDANALVGTEDGTEYGWNEHGALVRWDNHTHQDTPAPHDDTPTPPWAGQDLTMPIDLDDEFHDAGLFRPTNALATYQTAAEQLGFNVADLHPQSWEAQHHNQRWDTLIADTDPDGYPYDRPAFVAYQTLFDNTNLPTIEIRQWAATNLEAATTNGKIDATKVETLLERDGIDPNEIDTAITALENI